MTFTEIKTLLEAEGATGVDLGNSYPEFGTGVKIQPMYFFPPSDDPDVDSEVVTFKMRELGEDNYKYYGSKPTILRETPTVAPPRDFISTEQEVIDTIKSYYIAENGGTWTGDIYEDTLQRNRNGNRDEVTIDIVNNSNIVEKRKQFIISPVSAEPWQVWDNINENLYQIGDTVSHNGKIWEAETGDNH